MHTSNVMPSQKHTQAHSAWSALLLLSDASILFMFHSKQHSRAKTRKSPQFLRAPRDIRKLGFLDMHAGCAQSEHTNRCIRILTMYLHVRGENLYET